MKPKIITVAVALIVAGTIVFFVSQKKEDSQTTDDSQLGKNQTAKKIISPQDVQIKSGKFTGTPEQLKAREEAIKKGFYAASVADFNSGNPGLKQNADERFNRQSFIDKTALDLQDDKIEKNELMAALAVVEIRLDPAHEVGLRHIIKGENNIAKPQAMRLLVRLTRDQAIPAIESQTNSKDETVKRVALELLSDLGIGKKNIPKLLAGLKSSKARTRYSSWTNLKKTLKQLKKNKILEAVKKSGYDPRPSPARQAENIAEIEKLINNAFS
jgi:hypothetical protein